MTAEDSAKIDAYNAQLEQMTGLVRDTITKVQNGEDIDLGDLDEQVGALCEEIADSRPEIAQQVTSKMSTLISSLEELAQILSEHAADEDEGEDEDES